MIMMAKHIFGHNNINKKTPILYIYKILSTQRFRTSPYLIFCHCTNYKRANHAGQRAHAVGDTHEDASIPRSNVQVVHVETL